MNKKIDSLPFLLYKFNIYENYIQTHKPIRSINKSDIKDSNQEFIHYIQNVRQNTYVNANNIDINTNMDSNTDIITNTDIDNTNNVNDNTNIVVNNIDINKTEDIISDALLFYNFLNKID